MLPADLRQAESQALEALRSALAVGSRGRWTVEFRFEGLKVLPLALRLAEELREGERPPRLLFPDAGATALARRDAPSLAPWIASLAEHRRAQEAQAVQAAGDTPAGDTAAGDTPAGDTAAGAAPPGGEAPAAESPEPLLLLVNPGPSDYALVEALCDAHRGTVVLLNATLEDGAVGIGSVARARRKGFLAQWRPAYGLHPFADCALRLAHPGEWELYRLDPDGFRLAAHFAQKPTSEERATALTGEEGGGLQQQLRSLGELIDNL